MSNVTVTGMVALLRVNSNLRKPMNDDILYFVFVSATQAVTFSVLPCELFNICIIIYSYLF